MKKKFVIIFTAIAVILGIIFTAIIFQKSGNIEDQSIGGTFKISGASLSANTKNPPAEETFTFRGVKLEGQEEISAGIQRFVTETLPQNGLTVMNFPTIQKKSIPEDIVVEIPTEEEIFAFVNPPAVINALKVQQEDMVKRGILSDEKRSNFESNADIIDYFANIAEVYIRYASLTPAEEMRIREIAVSDLPQIMEYERRKYLRMRSRAFNPFLDVLYVIDEYFQQESIVEEFFSLLVPNANAEWVTTEGCYKDDSDSGSGYNGVAFCCNCGLSGQRYVDDCGTNGLGCDLPLGCLNSTCQNYGSAIYDSTSFICGCG